MILRLLSFLLALHNYASVCIRSFRYSGNVFRVCYFSSLFKSFRYLTLICFMGNIFLKFGKAISTLWFHKLFQRPFIIENLKFLIDEVLPIVEERIQPGTANLPVYKTAKVEWLTILERSQGVSVWCQHDYGAQVSF